MTGDGGAWVSAIPIVLRLAAGSALGWNGLAVKDPGELLAATVVPIALRVEVGSVPGLNRIVGIDRDERLIAGMESARRDWRAAVG